MKQLTILLLALCFSLPVYADDMADLQKSIDYRKSKLNKLKKEVLELQVEIDHMDQQIIENDGDSPTDDANPTYTMILTKLLDLEDQFLAKFTLLNQMKITFVEGIPLKKGDEIGTFTGANGKVYENAVVSSISKNRVGISFSGGAVSLKSTDFPYSMNKTWNLKPASDDLTDLMRRMTSARPPRVLKSKAYAPMRKKLARQRAARLRAESAKTLGR